MTSEHTGRRMHERLEWALDRLDECGKQVHFTLGMTRSIQDCREALRKNGARDHYRFGSPPEPMSNPSEPWVEAYADWYFQGFN